MRSSKRLFFLLLVLVISACGGGGGGNSSLAPVTLTAINVTGPYPSIAQNTSEQFKAFGTYSDKSTQDLTAMATWSSQNTSAASISSGGLAVAVAATATTVTSVITATVNGVSGSTSLTVTPATLVSLAIQPLTPTIARNTSQQFSAIGSFTYGTTHTTQDLTSQVTWSSTALAVATISNTGLATSLTAGSTKISATIGVISTSTLLTVSLATLNSIAILPLNQSATVGASIAFSATGTLSDGTTQDVTSATTWTSSNSSVATISSAPGSSGSALALAVGTTVITASIPVSLPTPGSLTFTTTLTVTGAGGGPANVLPITVNGPLCSSATSYQYFNKPCVSVTVCNPDGTNCQVINDILLDTGSYGLRVFKSAISTLSLTQVTAGSGSLAECVQYADDSSNWGPVQIATVILGGEPAIQVPIQVIDSTFGDPGANCPGAAITPADAGFTGILGVGLLTQDCGKDCISSARVGDYFTCSGSPLTCSGTGVPLANQVTNPVALLKTDNNGVLVQLPAVPLGGRSSVNGSLILGIGTQSNNAPGSATAYPANVATADFTTSFEGVPSNESFIDSGSNALYFPASSTSLPQDSSQFYIPNEPIGSALSFSATNSGYLGTPSGTVSFQIGNFDSLYKLNSSNQLNQVFSEVGGYEPAGFDWGLPFFFGRNVFVGFDGMSSPLGSGAYWAY